MWTEILKSLPRDRAGLIEMLKEDVAFRRLIRTLGRRELRGNHFIKDFLRQVDDMETSGQLETFLMVMQNTPPTDYPLEKLKENLATLRKTISYETDDLKIQILDEGLALLDKKESGELTDAEKNRLNALHTQISRMVLPKDRFNNRLRRDFRAKKKTFLRGFGGFTLTFAVPEEKQQEFEQKVDEFAAKTYEIRQGQGETNVGQRSGKKLITNFLDGKEFLDFLRANEQFKKDFTELARPFGPDLSGMGIKAREDDAKTKLQALHARKVVFKAAEIDTITEVNNYFDVVAEISGAKGVFMPRKVETSERIDNLPPSIFLLKNDANSIKSRSSLSRLRLNPYANKILLSGFSRENWFERLFEGVKMEITSEKEAMDAIYEDIFRIYNGKKSKLELDERDFSDLENLSPNPKTRKKQIKTYIERKEILGEIGGKAQELRLGRFKTDTETLTVQEGEELKKILDNFRETEKLDQEEFDETFGKIRLVPLNPDGTESIEVKLPSESPTKESFSDRQKDLENLKERREKLAERPLDEENEETQSKRDAKLAEFDKSIRNLESRIKSAPKGKIRSTAERRGTETITPVARYAITLAEPITEIDEDFEEQFLGFEKEQTVKVGGLLEYLESTSDVDLSDFSGQISRIRGFLGEEPNFQNYVGSLSPQEIKKATEMASGSQAFMDRIDPLNSLAFLSNLNELMRGYPDAGLVKKTLIQIADEQEPSDKAALIDELNTKMLPILKNMRKFMFKSVEDRLEAIGKDYLKLARGTQEKAILQAIEGFKEKRLLTGGE